MSALITGAQGQLGRDLARLLPDATALGREQLPIDDEALVRRHLAEVRPEVVYNCAAYNAVDAAEKDPEPAIAVNARGPENLARACLVVGARLVHFSTNYVFDGEAEDPYDEDDRPNPSSRYGRSKLEGEERVLALMPSALVVRSSGLFGLQGSAIKGGSFPERILARARSGQPLTVVADQRLNPTFTRDLAAGSHHLAESGMTGVVHLVAGGECSYWELAVEVLRLSGLSREVAKASTGDFPTAAPRPLNGCLRSHRTGPLRNWREGLAEYMDALVRTPS